MFKKSFILAALAALALAVTGCSSIKATDNFNQLPVDGAQAAMHLNGKTSGIFLFYFIPICSGSTEKVGSTAWFKDEVKLGGVTDMVTSKAKAMGATKLTNLNSTLDCSGASGYFIIWSKTAEVQCTASR